MQKCLNDDQKEIDDIMLQLFNDEKKRKRALALQNWKWDNVVDVLSSEDELEVDEEPSDTADTTVSATATATPTTIKTARIKKRLRNRCYRLRDESDEEDR